MQKNGMILLIHFTFCNTNVDTYKHEAVNLLIKLR